MDQSISIMAPQGSALLIDFYPTLGATPIKFPTLNPAPVFVIANTLVVADKHATAPTNYNLRVIETRLAAAVMMKNLSGNAPTDIINLRKIQDIVAVPEVAEIERLGIALDLVETHFKREAYSVKEVADILEISSEKLNELFVGSIIIKAPKGFKLYERAKHVFSEARRVLYFRDVCLSNPSRTTLKDLGKLMNESHESCRDLFNCSCPELDELRQISL
jgi:galactokinase